MPEVHADSIVINSRVRIPSSDLRFSFSRSPGPGGQNVNKVNTKVTLFFDLAKTASLSPAQKARIRGALHTRIDSDDVLRVVSFRHRSQVANRKAATERLSDLLAEALAPRKPRLKTRTPRSAHARRLQDKAHHAERKQRRRYRPSTDE